MPIIKQIAVGGSNHDLSPAEGFIRWGGANAAGAVTPIGMSLSCEHSANRLAYINGNALTIEYSSDGGSTYTDYGLSAKNKSAFCTKEYTIPVGRASSSTAITTSSRSRVTITARDGSSGYVYTNPKKLLINVSTAGGLSVLIETRTGTNYQSGGAWSTFATYALSGWSGWNDIPLILSTLGGGSDQPNNNWQLRLTFIATSVNANYKTTCAVNCIRLFGENAWYAPSTMAATGHLYTYDIDKNAGFPANVSATSFTENGVALSTKYQAKATVEGTCLIL